MVHVEGYERADGTQVRSHSRWAPGARHQMTILAVLVLTVFGYSATGTSSGGSGKSPRPGSTAVYPVKFPGQDKKPAPRPRPTVSYPIPWDRSSS